MATTHDYKVNNESDKLKVENLELLVKQILPTHFIEFHSGSGSYIQEDGTLYHGTAVRVLNILEQENIAYEAHLHEINSDRRQALRSAVKNYQNTAVHGDWRNTLEKLIVKANDRSLFVIDPTDMKDYDTDICKNLPKVIATGAAVFLFAPENKMYHGKILKQIYTTIVSSSRSAVDAYETAGNTGCFERHDHNIIIAPDTVISQIQPKLKGTCRKIS